MDSKTAYANKADLYAKYRWDYAPEAVEAIFKIAGLTRQSVVADIGAGTGILTRHFVGRVGMVYAVEPNMEMRWLLAASQGDRLGCAALEGSAEHTGLQSRSVDLITAAQAIHWFDPEPTLAEFRRISRAEPGWLALVSNSSKTTPLHEAVDAICTPEYGVDLSLKGGVPRRAPAELYFADQRFERIVFPFVSRQNFESFFGALCSVSYMPGAEHPKFEDLRRAVREIYEHHCPEGWNNVQGETQLIIGRLA